MDSESSFIKSNEIDVVLDDERDVTKVVEKIEEICGASNYLLAIHAFRDRIDPKMIRIYWDDVRAGVIC